MKAQCVLQGNRSAEVFWINFTATMEYHGTSNNPLIALYPPAIPPTYPSKWPITHRPSKGEGLLLERKLASTVPEPCLFFPWAWPVWRVIIQKWSCRGSFRWLRTLNVTGWQHGTGTLGCIFRVSWVNTQEECFGGRTEWPARQLEQPDSSTAALPLVLGLF